MKRVYKVTTRLDDSPNFNHYSVLARSANEAITRAAKLYVLKREVADEVSLVTELS